MNNRHAYMIMAHHRPDLLQLLIDALDDVRNDIIIHLDDKSDIDTTYFHSKHAPLMFIERMSINWGGYTQVECEYRLIKQALKLGHHSYYHFLTGANFPLWNQDYLHQFFINNYGSEFIGFDNGMDFSNRAKYYIPFSEYGKLSGLSGKIVHAIRRMYVIVQKIMNLDRLRREDLIIKKGCAYFSITEGMVKEIINNETRIKKLLNHTICCDEVFVQTVAYNSNYKDKIFDLNNEWEGSMRELAWPSNVQGDHPGWNFSMKDLNYLLCSNRLFAMKFESPDGVDVIKSIKKKRNIS